MKGKADVTFGGAAGGAALQVHLRLDDGHKWLFTGGFGFLGSPNVGHGKDLDADFGGLSHIDGDCAFQTVSGGMGIGGVQITFFDLQGQIGTIVGSVLSGGVNFGIGGGTWKTEL